MSVPSMHNILNKLEGVFQDVGGYKKERDLRWAAEEHNDDKSGNDVQGQNNDDGGNVCTEEQ